MPSNGRVGVDPFLMSASAWETLYTKLDDYGFQLVPVSENLVDLVWKDRPPRPSNLIMTQPIKWTGWSWEDKLTELRKKMKSKDCSLIVLSALDDVAWLLNLRGSDITFNPVFFSYVIVTMDSVL